MTLNTYVGISGDFTPEEIFDFCNTLIVPEGVTPIVSTKSWTSHEHIGNAPGQGFDAWLGVDYISDGPLFSKDVTYRDEDPGSEDDDLYMKACDIRVSFDTGYSYRGPQGESCSQLHAMYIRALHSYVTAKGGSLWWKDEYTRDIHDGVHGLDGEFALSGLDASEWLNNIVKPAIENSVGKDNITWL